jgi:phosphomannomutase
VRTPDTGAPIASHSGLRGRPGVELRRDAVEEVVGGLLELLAERELPCTLGLARDARPSGSDLAAEVIETATSRGADVIDFGIVCAPTAKLAARRRELGGAVVVTGSHLGPEWNGLKLVAAPEYRPLDVRALPRGQAPPCRASAVSVRQRRRMATSPARATAES